MIKQSNSNQDLTDNNPLALNDNNPWQQYFEDSEIRKTIRQDVERTFPDVDFFRDPAVQEKMTDILFIYCKIHHDVSYRQGMHELLAPFYWVLTDECWPMEGGLSEPSEPADRLIAQTLDPAYIEHDAYILFDKIMKYAKPWYEFNERISAKVTTSSPDLHGNNIPRSTSTTKLNPVVLSCHRIHHKYLRSTDPVLYEHLERYNIEPQLYGMRWLRLLFGREFEFYDLLKLWDAIYAMDPTLQIAEYVSLAILLRMRDNLLGGDYAECLTLLMRAPQVANPASLVEQAKYLQSELSEAGGLHVLQQNDLRQGKPPRHSLWEGVQRPEPLPNRIAHRRSHGANLDGLASITRGVMKSPQVRDFNRAIAGVMGTVQKNVNMFGDNVLKGSFDAPPSRRRLTVSSEFPSDIDRHFVATSANRPIPRTQPVRQQQTENFNDKLDKLVSTNRQMADLLAKSIDTLELEFFQDTEAKSEPDPAILIGALTGIKHVRDVLAGKQTFDPATLASCVDAAGASKVQVAKENAVKEEEREPKEVETKEDKRSLDWEIVSNDDKSERSSVKSDHLSTKPLPPLQQPASQPTAVAEPAPRTPHTPKQNVVYRIEDLISDPTLQRKEESDTKFKWIMTDDQSTKSRQFRSERISPSRNKRASAIHITESYAEPISSGISSPSSIDPLGARSMD
ncbi:rab-GTPase-TBC domain-containing protein [Fennellomyces sp. T-0311]|nr:rab-GTPase-TBC domain-containing protein [Fennellomyces sp. T-0311]